jgi:hypothetical protein
MAPKDPPKEQDSKDEKDSTRTGERASRPGAVSVSASQQAELLDQRIAEKTRAVSASAGATIVNASSESVRGDATLGARQELHQSEGAIQAKTASNGTLDAAAKQNDHSSAAVSSRPGAYAVTSLPNQIDALQGLEADAQAKQLALVGAFAESLDAKITTKLRGDVAQTPEQTVNSGHSVEADVSSKNMARASQTVHAQPGAYACSGSTLKSDKEQSAGMMEMECAIAAKLARWEAGVSPAAHTQPGAYASSGSALKNGKEQSAGMSEMETAIAAKLARWETSASQTAQAQPGAYASSGSMLADGAKKQAAGLNELESAIAAKMACWEAGVSQTAKAKPGAYASSDSTLAGGKNQTAGLNELESAISAKLARWEAGSCQTEQAQPGAYAASGSTLVDVKSQTAGFNELESAITAKLARCETGASRTAKTQPGAYASSGSTWVNGKQQTAGLNELESAMAAKLARWETGDTQMAQAQPGAHASSGSTLASDKQQTAGFNELESAIATKLACWEAGATVNTLENSIPARMRSHDTEAPIKDDVKAKVQPKPDSCAPSGNFQRVVEVRTDGGEGAESYSVRAAETPHQQLENMESALHVKLCGNSGDLPQAKSENLNIAVQSSTSLQALQSLEANDQSKMNTANEAAVSTALLSNFESQVMGMQHLGSETVDELGEASATLPRSPLDSYDIETSVLQHSGGVMVNSEDRVENKVPHNCLLQQRGDSADHSPDLENGEYDNLKENNLAVAVAVKENENLPSAEEEEYIPSAVEYDPDAKPQLNCRFQLYACLAMAVILVGTVGTLAGILFGRSSGTPPPLPERATLGIREYIERLVGREPVSDETNPYRKALDWIQNVDPLALTPQDKGFAQRFLAAYLYFSTTVQGPWNNDCNPAKEGETDDTVYRYTGVIDVTPEYELNAKRWLSRFDICLWCAVECDDTGQIIKIDLGTLPSFSSRRARNKPGA